MRRRQVWGEAVKKSPPPQFDPVKAYEAKFGRKPHHWMKLDTILARLNDVELSESQRETRLD